MLRVAILSFWHIHADGHYRQAVEHPDTVVMKLWDEDLGRGKQQSADRGIPYVEHLDEIWSDPDIDAVIVCAPTNRHVDIMVQAARAGKHIFTEKVLAPTLRECNEILQAVEQSGVKLMVALPQLYESYTLAIQDVLAKGLIGELTSARVRRSNHGVVNYPRRNFSHFFNKEQSHGGALIDVGCHPMYVARLFLGMPESVSASYGYMTGKQVEDNAVSVLRYANGALGTVESSFVNPFSPYSMELHGTEGVLLCGYPEHIVQLRTTRFGEEAATQWTLVDKPQRQPMALAQWVSHIQNDTIAEENIALAVDLTKLMEASNLSAALDRPVRIDSLAN
ncbi:Gfo/Idh/MocA family protein [Paenibacillus cymbidii]|uniref:Gfo/Idh/MocA family protein n=1 Tax=Paenibacillus cymbidii TaxID=1639034 RepID=UPI0010803CB0|nr:Gfo/Idh/MocA family oxidoreductase [Paenibacillus cymbidii]